ncbi:MAG: sialate O-acetylesterase [Puniceicoccaceae bacterium]
MKALRLLLTLSLLSIAFTLQASLQLPRLFQDGMVLQRGDHTQIWGWSDAGERIEVLFLGTTYFATADAQGNWSLQFATLEAGGPHQLVIRTQDEERVMEDVYVGDVWLASGQSNMELTMERVKYRFPEIVADSDLPLIRQFEVPDRYDFKSPKSDLENGSWVAADPQSVLRFSAVGYFFAREIHHSEGVPIGLINAALGGSPVQSWMSEDALQAFPEELAEGKRWADDGLIEETEQRERAASNAWYAELFDRDPGVVNGNEFLWADPATDTSDWTLIELPGSFTQAGLEAGPGVIWLKKTFELTSAQAAMPAQLWIGRIVDADKAFLNGSFVGEVTYQYPPRIYDVPDGLLREGTNTLIVRVVVNGREGKFFTDKPYHLKLNGEPAISLEGEWLAKQIRMDETAPGTTFVRWKPMGLFNGKIAPLTRFAIKGAIWYQGESNTSRPEKYQQMFETMVMDWRSKWVGNVEFPFLSVQLANLGEPDIQPGGSDSTLIDRGLHTERVSHAQQGENGWSLVREQQSAATRLPNSAIAVIYDVGEWNDIHPLDKQTVGHRLALAAKAIAYGHDEVIYKGPQFVEAAVSGDEVRVHFSDVGEGLRTRDDAVLGGFVIAGADKVFHWAEAEIEGKSTVVLRSEAVEMPVYVRYAWSQNPASANLVNSEGLPADAFRTDR